MLYRKRVSLRSSVTNDHCPYVCFFFIIIFSFIFARIRYCPGRVLVRLFLSVCIRPLYLPVYVYLKKKEKEIQV